MRGHAVRITLAEKCVRTYISNDEVHNQSLMRLSFNNTILLRGVSTTSLVNETMINKK